MPLDSAVALLTSWQTKKKYTTLKKFRISIFQIKTMHLNCIKLLRQYITTITTIYNPTVFSLICSQIIETKRVLVSLL